MWDSPGGCCCFNIPSRTARTVARDTGHCLCGKRRVGEAFLSSGESSQTHAPTCPCGLRTSLFSVAAFGHFCVPGSRDGIGSIGHAGVPHLPEDYSPAPSHSIQPRLDPFSGKALEGSIGVFNKEAHVVSRTVFVVFVTVLYLFRFFCVKALHTLTPSHRSDSRTLIQAFITLSF